MTLGERVKKLRKALDLTQQDFGKSIGIKSNSVSLIESNSRNASDQVILSICREFKASEEWLRTGKGEMFPKTLNTALEELSVDFYLDPFDEALIDEYLHLTPDQRKTCRDFFYRVLEKSAETSERKAGREQMEVAEETTPDVPKLDDDRLTPEESCLAAKVAELERQNQELATKVAAMEEEDAKLGLMDGFSISHMESAGNLSSKAKK